MRKLTKFSLFDAINDVVLRFSEQSDIAQCKIQIDCDNSEILGDWDPAKVEQIIVNLLTNSVLNCPGKAIKILASKTDSHAILTIKDAGYGFSRFKQSDELEKFEGNASLNPESSTNYLVLSTKTIVRNLRGEIKQVTSIGRGSTVTVKLPLSKDST